MSNFMILHKKEKNLNSNVLYNESDQTNICNIHEKEYASCNTIHHSSYIILHLYTKNLRNLIYAIFIRTGQSTILWVSWLAFSSQDTMEKPWILLKAVLVTALRLPIFSIPENGMMWLLLNTLKRFVIVVIYSEAVRTGKPVFCIADDTIAS